MSEKLYVICDRNGKILPEYEPSSNDQELWDIVDQLDLDGNKLFVFLYTDSIKEASQSQEQIAKQTVDKLKRDRERLIIEYEMLDRELDYLMDSSYTDFKEEDRLRDRLDNIQNQLKFVERRIASMEDDWGYALAESFDDDGYVYHKDYRITEVENVVDHTIEKYYIITKVIDGEVCYFSPKEGGSIPSYEAAKQLINDDKLVMDMNESTTDILHNYFDKIRSEISRITAV